MNNEQKLMLFWFLVVIMVKSRTASSAFQGHKTLFNAHTN